LNIVRQVGGSIATALFAVILQRQILENTHAHSNSDAAVLSQTVKLPPAIAEKVATAFAHTFWWAVAIILVAFIPTLFLPSHGANQAQNAALDAADAADAGDGGHDAADAVPDAAALTVME
jgi:hypothetical protein